MSRNGNTSAMRVDNLAYAEQMYQRWLDDAASVPIEWRDYFGTEITEIRERVPVGPRFQTRSIFNPATAVAEREFHQCGGVHCDRHMGVLRLIDAYRRNGHHGANLDPLGLNLIPPIPEPKLADFGLSDADLDTRYLAGDFIPGAVLTLRDLRERLRTCYAGTVGVEYAHMNDRTQIEWIRQLMESGRFLDRVTPEVERVAVDYVIRGEAFEQFLHRKFVGTKRFSLEGAEALIPALHLMVEAAAELDVETLIFGMAHRGRINVLANILHKRFEMIFNEFEDIVDPRLSFGSGDVKYHLGYNDMHRTSTGREIWLSLTPNPSHLEAVNPVVEGRCRARQDRLGRENRHKVLPVLIHGDAAFAGQGLVPETLNLGMLSGYGTGGTVHIVINNQLGFTTPPKFARSTIYCTDVAKMLGVPIFHVNGDDVRSFVGVVLAALEFRQKFGIDSVVDMYCFRRYGHNETDKPSFTQPRMYKKIAEHPGVRTLYSRDIVSRGVATEADLEGIRQDYLERLEAAYRKTSEATPRPVEVSSLKGPWSGIRVGTMDDFAEPFRETAITREAVEHIARRVTHLPETFRPHRKLRKLLDDRLKMGLGELPIDWGMGEMLAYGSLVSDRIPVRLSGQDCRRGTFSHRHVVFVDMETEDEYTPLANIRDDQAAFNAHDSLLSEAAVLGFEYGYAFESPYALVIWEAQFGDFVNGAQVIVDQFITSAEMKWKRHSGLVMLLPHGYEGQGPEHSSARPERFLALAAECNIQVCNVTTPAQFFHMIRRQMLREFRKPLVVMTPKSLLRHRMAVSAVEEFTDGYFRDVIPDPTSPRPESVDRVILCTGKIYYDLAEAREANNVRNVAIHRIEQLYPFPKTRVRELLELYPNAKVSWVQEEPANQGGWYYMLEQFDVAYEGRYSLHRVSRKASASPATGSVRKHIEQQRAIIAEALGIEA